jgi:uncharacterized protein YecA (UPF0149 family)
MKPVTTERVLLEMRQELQRLRKTPRNAPCPCGSRKTDGKPKKFKQCCLARTGQWAS